VRKVTPVHLLLFAAVLTPLLALWPSGQDPAEHDWAKDVDKACTSPRYGLRLAAARKVASGGGEAVPAVRAWAEQHGRNQLPSALVDAIADAGTLEQPVLQLLRDWALDRDFYWRAQAMRGLAVRGPLLPEQHDALRPLFASFHDSAAWLMRTHARIGSLLLGDDAVRTLPEQDPRARVRFAALAIEHGLTPDLQPLFDALADERTFLGDPWGQRIGAEAHKALKTWLGDAHPLAQGGEFADQASAITRLLAAARPKSGQDLQAQAPQRDPEPAATGGIEVFSCKNGDLFVQWTDAGEVRFGLDAASRMTIPAERWQDLTQKRSAIALDGTIGVVVCDSLRLRWSNPELHARLAPASLPADARAWLEQFAQAIEATAGAAAAAPIAACLEQFAAQ
jgi:hypothetical protein